MTRSTRKPKPKKDREWFERKVAELGRALDRLRPERQDKFQELLTGTGEGEHSDGGAVDRAPGKSTNEENR